ncbi:MAG: hypothetical protein K9N06_00380 [Candidatus Cloacimonetes bacterium]|nr:hypothetical protein [Candidatus Cloacimonadota bacterium]
MFRLRKSTKYLIIIAVILATGYFAVKISGITTIFNSSIPAIIIDDDHAEKVFEKLDNEKKIKMIYNAVDLKVFTRAIQDIYTKYSISPQYSNITGNYYVSIFDYPKEHSEEVMDDLRHLQTLNREFLASADPEKFKINIDDHIANKVRVKRTLEKKIDNAILMSDERISNFNQELTRIQLEIDSLNNQKNMIQQLADNNLVYLVTTRITAPSDSVIQKRRFNLLKNFILYYFAFLIAGILFLIVFNYFFLFLLYLMRILGIKTSRSSSGGYNYGGQSYRSKYYYRRPKKVKRIYKDSDGNIIKQKVSKE